MPVVRGVVVRLAPAPTSEPAPESAPDSAKEEAKKQHTEAAKANEAAIAARTLKTLPETRVKELKN